MVNRSLVSALVVTLWCALDSFSLANAAVEINVAKLSNGTFGKVIGISNIMPAGTATAVIQGTDKFGNLVNRSKTLTVNAAKYGGWARGAMSRIPAVQVAIGLAAAAAGYLVIKTVDDFGVVGYDIYKPGAALPGLDVECPKNSSIVKNPSGIGNVQAFIPTPCYRTDLSTSREYWTTAPSDELSKWATPNVPNVVTRWQSTSVSVEPTMNPTYIYKRGISVSNPEVKPSSVRVPATDNELASWGFQSPDGMQESPGKFPDIWNTVPWEDTATNDEIINPPTSPGGGTDDPNFDPCNGSCADSSDLATSVFDITSYLKWGSGWMPRQCPAPQLLWEFKGEPLFFDYSTLCKIMTDYVAPFIRFTALLGFIAIVAGGLRE